MSQDEKIKELEFRIFDLEKKNGFDIPKNDSNNRIAFISIKRIQFK